MTTELTATQKKEECLNFALLKTFEKAIKAQKDKVQPTVEEIMHADYLEDGIEKRTARIGNTIVGTLTAVKDKACYVVTDVDAYVEWLESYDLGTAKYKADVRASREIHDMLAKHYSEEEIAHLFIKEPDVYKETEKRILACDDVCLLEGLPEVIPGIKPNVDRFKYLRVTDTNLTTCVNALGTDGIIKLLSAPTGKE